MTYFDGMPNEWWQLKDAEITKSLVAAKKAGKFGLPEQMPSKLGYSGLLVQDNNTKITELLVGIESFALQMRLIETMPKYSEKILIEDRKAIEEDAKKIKFEKARRKRYAPQYDAREWDGDTALYRRRFCNSAYDYANEKVTNSYAMPGYASGTNLLTVPALLGITIQNAAVADGMTVVPVPLPVPAPGAALLTPPTDGNHLVFFRFRPGK